MLKKLTSFVGGSLFKEVKESIFGYFPPDLSPQQKAELELKIERLLIEKQAIVNELLRDSAFELDKRIANQEGVFADLKSVPILGHLVLFIRGVQRPTWVFATLWIDFQWFFDELTFSSSQETTLIVINSLVLGFLFGERAVQNLAPTLNQVFKKK